MLTRLDLHCFKCFHTLKLPLAPLTLLSGTNASGKSSVLQSLVLLHQTMREQEWSTRLMLNGDTIRLGVVSDVVDQVYGRRSMGIRVEDDEVAYDWSFSGERDEMSMTVDLVRVDGKQVDAPENLKCLLPVDLKTSATVLAARLMHLTYITAERIGPREIYSIEDRQIASVVGPAGEHAVSMLNWGRDEQVIDKLVLEGTPPTRLRQVEERMRNFFPGCGLVLRQVPQANAVTLGLRTSDDTDFHRPVHVGFGLTQVFPIIVAALSMAENDILLIENPEVHLHPAGQAAMGCFLAEVANAGVQVLVESHSDHVLNGIRRAVKAQLIDPARVALHFFRPRMKDLPQVETPVLDASGNIDSWPEGFFDQFDKDMNHFAGWGN